VRPAAAFDVQTARTVTRFATDVLRILAFRLETGMRRSPKIARNIFVTGLATFRAGELRSRDARWRENSLVCFERAARKQNHGERGRSPGAPKKLFAPTVDPSS
jgi:hypothetical protein